jgi:hypothetical protein
MKNQLFDQFSPFIFMGIMVVGVACAVYYFLSIFNPASDFSAEDAQAIAKYKEWIDNNNVPLVGGKIKPEDRPLVYRKVIEYDIKAGDLKSARNFINEAIQKQFDAKIVALAQLPAAKDLIGQMQNAHRKVEALKGFVVAVQKRSTEQAKEQPDSELARLTEEFCQVPFDPSACPEHAEEIASIYKASLLPLKEKDEAVKKVIGEIEKNCQPPKAGQ